jgi:hypothetical protein
MKEEDEKEKEEEVQVALLVEPSEKLVATSTRMGLARVRRLDFLFPFSTTPT